MKTLFLRLCIPILSSIGYFKLSDKLKSRKLVKERNARLKNVPITNKEKIFELLTELEVDLAKHKNPSAEYFKSVRENLMVITNDEEFRDYMDRLSGIGPMAQYGGFSLEQTNLLSKLISEAFLVLK